MILEVILVLLALTNFILVVSIFKEIWHYVTQWAVREELRKMEEWRG